MAVNSILCRELSKLFDHLSVTFCYFPILYGCEIILLSNKHLFLQKYLRISAVAVIIVAARQRSVVRKEKTSRQHLFEQFRLSRHPLISPCILVLIALPRPIISLVSDCIQTRRAYWLLIIGYFISTLNVLVFVLFSETHKEEFFTAAEQLR